MKIFYKAEYTRTGYAFDTVRKAADIAQSLRERPLEGVQVVAGASATRDQLALAHSAHYVEAVRTGRPDRLASSQGFPWDKRMYTATTASTGGVIAAAYEALRNGVSGSLSSGLHHAKAGWGEGFCTFNGLAIAARQVIATNDARKVLILDLDAHCGGGTYSIIKEDRGIYQCDISTSHVDQYLPTIGHTLYVVKRPTQYIRALTAYLEALDQRGPRFDLILYNAGMDPYEGCPIGGLEGITAEVIIQRESLVFQWARKRRTPIAFVLAGGYTGKRLPSELLVNLHRLTIAKAASSARNY